MQVKEKANFLQTPSQTAGPYVHIGLLPDAAGHTNLLPRLDAEVLWSDVREGRIEITGRISDGAGDLVKDATIEFWQADVSGHYVAAAANDMLHGRGWGRCSTDFQSGLFKISTLKPGAVVDAAGRLTHRISRYGLSRVDLTMVFTRGFILRTKMTKTQRIIY